MLRISNDKQTCVRDGSGYPFCLWMNVNLDDTSSGQKDMNGQPAPLVFADGKAFLKGRNV